jgi:hypothetical protein
MGKIITVLVLSAIFMMIVVMDTVSKIKKKSRDK